MRILLLILFSHLALAQKGGLPTYPVTKYDPSFIAVDNSDSLLKYASIAGSKIYITKSLTLKSRITVAANVVIESDLKTITSKLFYSTFRVFESFLIAGKNVMFRGLNLVGDDPDVRTLDTMLYQCGIRCHADSFTMINCRLSKWGWACLYLHLFNGARIEQCYFADTKNNGYGYGVWFEGKPGHAGIVKDCHFSNLREAVDAGGQLNYITLSGNVTDAAFCSHKNGNGFTALGTTITGNYFYSSPCGVYYPADSGGTLSITNNYFTDTARIVIEGTSTESSLIVSDNKTFSPSSFSIVIDSIVNGRVYFQFPSSYPLHELFYGDASDRIFTTARRFNKSYTAGSYTIKARGIDKNGIPTKWGTVRFTIQGGVTCFVKSGSRFSKAGNYFFQILVNDTVVYSIDATKIWQWKKVQLNVKPGKLAARLTCKKSTKESCIIFIDDLDYNGTLSNSDFETKLFWIQKLAAFGVGSGQDSRERTSGQFCYRFEFRNELNTPGYGEIYQTIR